MEKFGKMHELINQKLLFICRCFFKKNNQRTCCLLKKLFLKVAQELPLVYSIYNTNDEFKICCFKLFYSFLYGKNKFIEVYA